MTLTIKLDGNWSSFQLANNTPPLSVTGSVIAPSARMLAGQGPEDHQYNTATPLLFQRSGPPTAAATVAAAAAAAATAAAGGATGSTSETAGLLLSSNGAILPCGLAASQRSLHYAPIFRLLLKVAVKGTHQCDLLNFCGGFWSPTLLLLSFCSCVVCAAVVLRGHCVCWGLVCRSCAWIVGGKRLAAG